MAKPSGRKLKVFQAQIGFHDTVVAASSMPAALFAWGIRQDLFASGQARVTDDEQAVAAALANPETPLRRVVGTAEPFELNPTGLPTVPDAPPAASARPAAKAVSSAEAAVPARPNAPPPERSKLTKAEAELRRIDEKRKLEEAELRERQEQLDTERTTSQEVYVANRKRVTAAMVEARQAYRQLGGTH